MSSFNKIAELAAEEGLSLLSFIPRQGAENLLKKEQANLNFYQEKGYAGQMRYMSRPSSLYSSLDTVLADYHSLISLAWPYPLDIYLDTPLPSGFGRVASYAWRGDYHIPFKEKLIRLAEKLRAMSGKDFRYRCFVDAAPILERPLAQSGGLGQIGKNGLFIRPHLGSYMFIGEIVSDLEVETVLTSDNIAVDLCKNCCRCRVACPNQALVADYVLDARLCISYLSIEKRGALSAEESRQLGEWLWGCDLCQACCPYNKGGRAAKEDINYFTQAFIDLNKILKIRDEQTFLKLYQKSAFVRGGREQLLRNACCVAANSHAAQCIDQLICCLLEDSSEIIRRQAYFALDQLKEEAMGLDRSKILQVLDKL